MPTSRLELYGLCLVSVLVLASPVVAQQARSEGWWSDLGFGCGWNVTDAANAGTLGVVWQTKGGITVSPHLRVGLDLTSWNRWDPPLSSSAQASNMTVDAIVFPSGTLAGPHGKVGLGLSDADVWNEIQGVRNHAWGFGATFGIGYGLRLAGTDYLNFRFDWMIQAFPREVGRPSSNHTFAINIGVTSP